MELLQELLFNRQQVNTKERLIQLSFQNAELARSHRFAYMTPQIV